MAARYWLSAGQQNPGRPTLQRRPIEERPRSADQQSRMQPPATPQSAQDRALRAPQRIVARASTTDRALRAPQLQHWRAGDPVHALAFLAGRNFADSFDSDGMIRAQSASSSSRNTVTVSSGSSSGLRARPHSATSMREMSTAQRKQHQKDELRIASKDNGRPTRTASKVPPPPLPDGQTRADVDAGLLESSTPSGQHAANLPMGYRAVWAAEPYGHLSFAKVAEPTAPSPSGQHAANLPRYLGRMGCQHAANAASGARGAAASVYARHRPPSLGYRSRLSGSEQPDEFGAAAPDETVQALSSSGLKYQQLDEGDEAPGEQSTEKSRLGRLRGRSAHSSGAASGSNLSDLERGGASGGQSSGQQSNPTSPLREQVFEFFAGLMGGGQFDDDDVPLPDDIGNPPLPSGAMPEYHARIPLRLWRGNPSTVMLDDNKDGVPPVRLVRIPLASASGQLRLDEVRACFRPDANDMVSLRDLAHAPSRIAAILRAERQLKEDGADTKGESLKRIPSTHRLREAAGGPGKEPDWNDLIDLLEAPSGNAVGAEDLEGLVPTDTRGKVPLAELLEYAAVAPASLESPSSAAAAAADVDAGRGAAVLLGSPTQRSKAGSFDRLSDGSSKTAQHSPSSSAGPKKPTTRYLTGRHTPYFIFFQTCVALVLYAVFGLANRKDSSWVTAMRGLDTMFPGMTTIRIHNECEDLRWQFIWRAFTYQFTHVGLSHIATNVLMNLVLGVPLEEFHGTRRLSLMYNIGVFGGACCAIVSDVHSEIVGMSGGCYALLGMHMADLIMNWNQRKNRILKLLLLFTLVIYDTVSAMLTMNGGVSHATHFGGYFSGLIIAIVLGRNVKWHRWERHLQYFAFGLGVVLATFCLGWGLLHWAPRSIWEDESWCTTFQVSNSLIFGDNQWKCVRCDSQECADRWWASQKYIAAVTKKSCELRGGWTVSER